MKSMKHALLLIATAMSSTVAFAAPNQVMIQGRLEDVSLLPITGTADITVRVYSPDDLCVLYSETHSGVALPDGRFSFALGSAGPDVSSPVGSTLAKTFDNTVAINGLGVGCTGNSYTPAANHNRRIEVLADTGSGFEAFPAYTLNAAAFAMYASNADNAANAASLGGKAANMYILKNTALGVQLSQANLEAVFGSSAYVTKLLNFLGSGSASVGASDISTNAVSSTQIIDNSITSTDLSSTGVSAGTYGSGTQVPQFTVDSKGRLTFAGNVSITSGAGSVTQVNTGTGLTGGGFTSSGTISIAPSGVGATELASDSVSGAKIVDATITGADLAGNIGVTTTGNVDAANFNASGNVVATNVSATIAASRELQLVDPDDATIGAKRVKMVAPLAIAADYTLTWPLDDGGVGQVLTTDGAGFLTWQSPAGIGAASIGPTELQTDAVTTVKILDANVTTSKIADGNITGVKLANDSVSYAKLQNVAPGSILGNPTGASADAQEITVGSGLTLSVGGVLSANAAGAPVVSNSSNLANTKIWIGDAGGKAQEFALSGDATMSNIGYVTVDWVGGTSASTVASGVGLANAATNAATNNAIVKRDGSGGFSANAIAAATLSASGAVSGTQLTGSSLLYASGGYLKIAPTPLNGSAYAGLVQIDSTNANTLKWYNGSTWMSAGGGTGDFLKNGTIAMTGNFQTGGNWISGDGGNEGINIDIVGNVGVGTASPSAALHLKAGTATANTAPLKLTAGTNMTVPEPGAIEYDGTNLYYTNNSSSRQTLAIAGSGSTTASSLGVVGTPVFNFSTDTDTGAWSPTADTYAVSTGGLERMRVSATGNVGIGTTAPARVLHTSGPIRINPAGLPGSAAAGDLAFDSGAANALKFYNGAGWQTVSTSVGTGDFMANGSVAMTGQLKAYGGNPAAPGITFNGFTGTGLYNPGSNLLGFSTAGSEKMRITTGGTVGIGTTAPNSTFKLDVNGPINSSTYYQAAGSGYGFIQDDGTNRFSTYFNGGTIEIGAESASDLGLQAGNMRAMTILQSGNVGIGTVTPTALLQLPASTGSPGSAPLKLTSGTNLTTPEAGAIEFDGTNLFYTNSSYIRQTLAISGGAPSVSNASPLASGKIWVGDAGNKAQEVTLSNDATITNTGALTIAAGAVSPSKMASMAGNTLLGNATGSLASPTAVTLSALIDSTYATPSTGSMLYKGGGGWTATSGIPTSNQIVQFNGSTVSWATIGGSNFGSQTANYVFAAPNGSAGNASFRALAAADIPSLDVAKITTGTFASARLAVGGSASNFLRGDMTWQTISNGDFMSNGSIAMAGALKASNGSVTGPGLTFAGYTSTGLYTSGLNDVNVSAGGAQVMGLTSTAVTAFKPLMVQATSATTHASVAATAYPSTAQLSAINSTATNDTTALVRFAAMNGNSLPQNAYIGAVSTAGAANYSPAIVIGQQTGTGSSVERMRIDQSGNVGIGTTNPSAPLTVQSVGSPAAVSIARTSPGSQSAMMNYQTGTASPSSPTWMTGMPTAFSDFHLDVFDGTSTFTGLVAKYSVTAPNLKIGIGTASPTAPLDVVGHIASSGPTPTITGCGTGATFSGTPSDTRGSLVVGSGLPASCQITFNSSYLTTPVCVVSVAGASAQANVLTSNATTTTLSIMSNTSMSAGLTLNYICIQ